MTLNTDKLIKGPILLERLFEKECRPSLRTLRSWQKKRLVPFYKIGHDVWFDEDKVRDALAKRNYVRSL